MSEEIRQAGWFKLVIFLLMSQSIYVLSCDGYEARRGWLLKAAETSQYMTSCLVAGGISGRLLKAAEMSLVKAKL